MIYSQEFTKLKEYRQNVADSNLKSASIVCYEADINEAFTSFKNQYDIKIERFLVPSSNTQTPSTTLFEDIPVEKLEDNFNRDDLVVYVNIQKICTMNIVSTNKKEPFYFYTDEHYSNGCFYYQKPKPSLYLCHKSELNQAYNLLTTKKSKKVFLQRLKSIITGKYGYLYHEEGYEYFPQELMPTVEKGSTVIDAGIGSSLSEIVTYSNMVGEQGKVYAFEASPIVYANLKRNAETQQGCKNAELINLGLWDENTTMKMTVADSSSSVAFAKTGETIDCELVSLDSFVEDRYLKKIDYIKMDIEGAELQALKGAKKTIQRDKPNMAICVYHFTSHLWELILFINSIYDGYDFYLYHHSPGLGETVLYAVKKSVLRRFLTFLYKPFSFLSKLFCFNKIYKAFLTRHKKVLIYGAGRNFEKLHSQGVFKNMNIIGVSDIKYENKEEEKVSEYIAVPPSKIEELNPELIYIAMADKPLAYDYLHSILKDKMNYIKIINL